MKSIAIFSFLLLIGLFANAQTELDNYNIVWTSQSKNSGESMPCGGGDIGLNVWAENGDIFFYVARSGTFDENNALLKLGRVRLRLSPNPFAGGASFRQELMLKDGYVRLSGKKDGLSADVKIWVDVFSPVVNVEVNSSRKISATASYESWRSSDRLVKGKENNANSYKWAPQGEVKTLKDQIAYDGGHVLFYHRNEDQTVFDVTVKQQDMDAVKGQLFNPLKNLTFGGVLMGDGMEAAGISEGKYLDTDFKSWSIRSATAKRSQQISLMLHTSQGENIGDWKKGLSTALKSINEKSAWQRTQQWWNGFWQRSYIFIGPANAKSESWQVGRNYQLMRYMLGCNAFGAYPTKFNGGLFTYDPALTDSAMRFTPDFRNWGGGIHTAQNQRLVYWPMLKSGDFDLMKPQFDFYLRILKNAELRSEYYWKHKGASFTEQLEDFGLPNSAEYNWKRPADYDKGMEHNAWLEYYWDTVLEFCMMMLETERYQGKDIQGYIPFIESCLTFFNEHYQYLARQRGSKALDGDGHLVLYPGSATETYKMAYNAASTVAALKTVLSRLLELPENYLTTEKRKDWQLMLSRIPPLSFRGFNGHATISPARLWERVNHTESPQLYPVFPWGMYGIGKPGLDTAINTFKYDPDLLKARSHIGWRQDNIFAARLGLSTEAWALTSGKLKDSGRRFPAFWGPGFDWTPDHNWGGSGMIGLQEMLLQADGKKIYLFPAWPKDKDVRFKLNAPYQTTIEASLKNGKIEYIKVSPELRSKDVVLP